MQTSKTNFAERQRARFVHGYRNCDPTTELLLLVRQASRQRKMSVTSSPARTFPVVSGPAMASRSSQVNPVAKARRAAVDAEQVMREARTAPAGRLTDPDPAVDAVLEAMASDIRPTPMVSDLAVRDDLEPRVYAR